MPLDSLGLACFEALCAAADTVQGLQGACTPGSDAWCALTELVQGLDRIIDRLVHFPQEDDA